MKTRANYSKIENHLTKKEFTILIGARQIGKSTLLKQLYENLLKVNKPAYFINLDRKEILIELNKNPLNIFDFFPLIENERITVFIDEIQYLNDPTGFLKLLYDEYGERIKIVATGSSAFYMDKNFKDSLVGRKKIFEMLTLTFQEFLDFKDRHEILKELIQLKTSQKKKSLFENELWSLLDEYCNYGSYPAVVLEKSIDNKKELLHEIKDSYIKRDVLESNIRDEDKFYKLMMLLANQSGQLLNNHELSKTLRVSNVTIENYLFVLQKCFHLHLIKPFYNNLNKELVKMPKVYFNDLGLRNILLNYFAPIENRIDKGALFENLVYRQMVDVVKKEQIKFWRTTAGNEIDFVVEQSALKGLAFECKFNLNSVNAKKYELFKENYPKIPFEFLSWRDLSLFKKLNIQSD